MTVEAGAATSAWTSAERESFFAAIARHRRAAWRVSVASLAADLLVAVVVAVLMSPLFYAIVALGFDLVNLVHRAPNLVTVIGRALDPALHAKGPVPLATWLRLGLLAAIPGLAWMALVLLMVNRVLRGSGMFAAGAMQARAPDAGTLAEQRFGNVVQEMAVAASLPAPRVLIRPGSAVNAAVFGRDERHATVLVSEGLLSRLTREQQQGIAAHLVGSIANGDMAIGLRAATTLSLFAFLSRFAGILGAAHRGRALLKLCVPLWRPGAAQQLVGELTDPFPDEEHGAEPARTKSWRDSLWLPLMGPLVITGFLAGLVQLLLLAPLVALAWRQRKYLADATAVRLTRDPDTLAGALEVLDGADASATFAAWAGHLCVVSPRGRTAGPMGSSAVPMCPSVARRLRALQRLGAHVTPRTTRLPWQALVILVPLGALLAGLLLVAAGLLAYVSIPLSALFLGIPFAILHALLRWLAGQ